MKRLICLFLAVLLALGGAACAKPDVSPDPKPVDTAPVAPPETTEAPADPTGTEDTTPEETLPEAMQLPLSAVFMPLITQETYAEDGAVLFRSVYQNISMTVPDHENADAIIMDLLNRIDALQEMDAEILQWAKEAYTGQDGWFPYFSEILYSPVRIDEKVLSFYGKAHNFGGGVHSNFNCISANYDLVTGKALNLADVLLDQEAAQQLSELIVQELDLIASEHALYDGYDTVARQRYSTVFDTAWEPTDAWYLSESGLSVYFSPYEIAPYAAGEIVVTVDYDKLDGILKDDYFPAGLPAMACGMITPSLAQDVDLENFTQFAEAILDTEGERVILYSDGLVTNVTLELGYWSSDGIWFIPQATVFSANTLTPGDAIMLQVQFPDVMPILRLRFTSGDTSYSYFISQSGKDGSIYLLDDLT